MLKELSRDILIGFGHVQNRYLSIEAGLKTVVYQGRKTAKR